MRSTLSLRSGALAGSLHEAEAVDCCCVAVGPMLGIVTTPLDCWCRCCCCCNCCDLKDGRAAESGCRGTAVTEPTELVVSSLGMISCPGVTTTEDDWPWTTPPPFSTATAAAAGWWWLWWCNACCCCCWWCSPDRWTRPWQSAGAVVEDEDDELLSVMASSVWVSTMLHWLLDVVVVVVVAVRVVVRPPDHPPGTA